jgi:hypothetical protein
MRDYRHVEARNQEYLVGKFADEVTCVYLYRGILNGWCSVHGPDRECPEGCGAEWLWLVETGDGDDFCLEVYDRATTSVWAPLTRDDVRAIAEMLTEAAT